MQSPRVSISRSLRGFTNALALDINFAVAQAITLLIFIPIELRHKYGEVITLDINEGKLVVLNTAEAIHEGFVKNSTILSDRPMSMHNPATGGRRDLLILL